MISVLEVRGLSSSHAALVADDFLRAELEGKTTHGLGRFLLLDSILKERGGPPQTTIDSGAFALVDAKKELGLIGAKMCIDILKTKAEAVGIAMVGMINYSRVGRLDPYGRMLADAGLVGIVMNGGRPARNHSSRRYRRHTGECAKKRTG